MLYVVFDDTGRCLVSRDDPALDRRAERADYDGVVAVVLGDQREDGAMAAPDLSGVRLLTGSIESLTGLAARCASFVRAESVLHTAHEAVRRADESLNRGPAAVPDDMRDLSERTEAIMTAYRELTVRAD